ncbi:hypothetical protein H4S02_001075 [Coemansia sp. RSA 2611]|nr:hypothetical protein LPJ70_003076 [Coemansia sp. RSA 2708]KAJ2325751.1 hypothetical protein IWW51_002635 [Coemansia sp. RSA 2702]KAJ2391894.1 hypothetical protein H4S02_001075 [Coemansia sp. RSA 2611]
MTQCNLPRKYTVSVPGLGCSCADSIQGLRIANADIGALVERVVVADAAKTIWLDIQSPTIDDVAALEGIFGIDSDTVQRLQCGAAGQGVDAECLSTAQSLYICWAEVAASAVSASQYFAGGGSNGSGEHARHSGVDSDATAVDGWSGGYVPVPPWMQPSATEVLSRLNLQRKPRKADPVDVTSDPRWEDARRRHIRQILGLISKPVVSNTERMRAVLRRWGPGHEQWWQEVLSTSSTQRRRPAHNIERLTKQLGQGARELIGYRAVQVWTRGPVLVTLHRYASESLQRTQSKFRAHDPRLHTTEPLAIIQMLVEHWEHATRGCLQILEQFTDLLDRDLTIPVRTRSLEAANWTPVIARCRKASLAFLRRCQINETVLNQLCRVVPSQARQELELQRARSADARILYKKTEQRLSRLHRILLDRQRLRLVSTQKEIHRYFRILVTVELVFLPIELWYNVDNLNGITTPGELQPENATDEDFWLSVVGMVVWAIAAIALYAIYTKFFERK